MYRKKLESAQGVSRCSDRENEQTVLSKDIHTIIQARLMGANDKSMEQAG
jgi:hypothetical protein